MAHRHYTMRINPPGTDLRQDTRLFLGDTYDFATHGRAIKAALKILQGRLGEFDDSLVEIQMIDTQKGCVLQSWISYVSGPICNMEFV